MLRSTRLDVAIACSDVATDEVSMLRSHCLTQIDVAIACSDVATDEADVATDV